MSDEEFTKVLATRQELVSEVRKLRTEYDLRLEQADKRSRWLKSEILRLDEGMFELRHQFVSIVGTIQTIAKDTARLHLLASSHQNEMSRQVKAIADDLDKATSNLDSKIESVLSLIRGKEKAR